MTPSSTDRIFEEVAFIAYYFHWDPNEILNMPHAERIRWCEEISKINKRIMDASKDRTR